MTSRYFRAGPLQVAAWPARKNRRSNPYQYLLYEAIEREHEHRVHEATPRLLLSTNALDIFHIHWPDVFLAHSRSRAEFHLRLSALRSLLTRLRSRGTRVVWTAHNLRRKEQANSALLELHFWPTFHRYLDGVIFLTESSRETITRSLPALGHLRASVIPHHHYRGIIDGPEPASTSARPHLVAFGSSAAYKRFGSLVASFSKLPAGTLDITLIGALSKHAPDHQMERLLAGLSDGHRKHLQRIPHFVEEKELIFHIRAADGAVFPYSEALNSGSAIFALSVGRPILTTPAPAFLELLRVAGPEWVQIADNEISPGTLEAFARKAGELRAHGIPPRLDELDPSRVATQTVEFYRTLTLSSPE